MNHILIWKEILWYWIPIKDWYKICCVCTHYGCIYVWIFS